MLSPLFHEAVVEHMLEVVAQRVFERPVVDAELYTTALVVTYPGIADVGGNERALESDERSDAIP